MTFPTTVYVLMQHDTEGKPRGFEKASRLFFMSESGALGHADRTNAVLPDVYHVHECVILGAAEYQALQDKIYELELERDQHFWGLDE